MSNGRLARCANETGGMADPESGGDAAVAAVSEVTRTLETLVSARVMS